MHAAHSRAGSPGSRRAACATRSCLYTVAPDFGFLLDVLPGHGNVVVASPCSGHGFKHSAAVGECAAALALGRTPPLDVSRSASADSPRTAAVPGATGLSRRRAAGGARAMMGRMEFQEVVAASQDGEELRPGPTRRRTATRDRILQNALRGPSAGFSQGFEFLVCGDRAPTASGSGRRRGRRRTTSSSRTSSACDARRSSSCRSRTRTSTSIATPRRTRAGPTATSRAGPSPTGTSTPASPRCSCCSPSSTRGSARASSASRRIGSPASALRSGCPTRSPRSARSASAIAPPTPPRRRSPGRRKDRRGRRALRPLVGHALRRRPRSSGGPVGRDVGCDAIGRRRRRAPPRRRRRASVARRRRPRASAASIPGTSWRSPSARRSSRVMSTNLPFTLIWCAAVHSPVQFECVTSKAGASAQRAGLGQEEREVLRVVVAVDGHHVERDAPEQLLAHVAARGRAPRRSGSSSSTSASASGCSRGARARTATACGSARSSGPRSKRLVMKWARGPSGRSRDSLISMPARVAIR